MAVLQIKKHVSLADYSTMRLGGTADYLVHIHSEAELLEALAFATQKQIPFKVIGGGSNLIWPDTGYSGLVLVNALQGVQIKQDLIIAQSGVVWDSLVEQSVEAGLSGLEFLSLIPGTTGAVPVQNVGAYGAEVSESITMVRAYDMQQQNFVELANKECSFSYRSSRFNTVDVNRFIITSVSFRLQRTLPSPPFYKALQEYLEVNNVDECTPATIRAAIIAIRTSKLPDPAVTPNSGSFFKNPIITKELYETLKNQHPTIPGWPTETGVKVPAAWLLEQAGLKGVKSKTTGMATYKKQPLVLINESAKTTADLLEFKDLLVQTVYKKFGITLVQEPELIV